MWLLLRKPPKASLWPPKKLSSLVTAALSAVTPRAASAGPLRSRDLEPLAHPLSSSRTVSGSAPSGSKLSLALLCGSSPSAEIVPDVQRVRPVRSGDSDPRGRDPGDSDPGHSLPVTSTSSQGTRGSGWRPRSPLRLWPSALTLTGARCVSLLLWCCLPIGVPGGCEGRPTRRARGTSPHHQGHRAGRSPTGRRCRSARRLAPPGSAEPPVPPHRGLRPATVCGPSRDSADTAPAVNSWRCCSSFSRLIRARGGPRARPRKQRHEWETPWVQRPHPCARGPHPCARGRTPPLRAGPRLRSGVSAAAGGRGGREGGARAPGSAFGEHGGPSGRGSGGHMPGRWGLRCGRLSKTPPGHAPAPQPGTARDTPTRSPHARPGLRSHGWPFFLGVRHEAQVWG